MAVRRRTRGDGSSEVPSGSADSTMFALMPRSCSMALIFHQKSPALAGPTAGRQPHSRCVWCQGQTSTLEQLAGYALDAQDAGRGTADDQHRVSRSGPPRCSPGIWHTRRKNPRRRSPAEGLRLSSLPDDPCLPYLSGGASPAMPKDRVFGASGHDGLEMRSELLDTNAHCRRRRRQRHEGLLAWNLPQI